MLAWGIAPGTDAEGEARFQRWCLGQHRNPGAMPQAYIERRARGAKQSISRLLPRQPAE